MRGGGLSQCEVFSRSAMKISGVVTDKSLDGESQLVLMAEAESQGWLKIIK